MTEILGNSSSSNYNSEEIDKMKNELAGEAYGYNCNDNMEVNNEEREIQEEANLAKTSLTKDQIDSIFTTIKKEAEFDELSIKQIFYGFCSAFTKLPIPHVVNSKDSGAGKSYLLNHVAGFFPDKNIIMLSGMSDKALYHREGPSVIENEKTGEVEFVDPIINKLTTQIEELQDQVNIEKNKDSSSKDKELIKDKKGKIKEIESEINSIQRRAEKLIDLTNQIIIFQDTPQPTLYDVLMTLLSQDSPRDQKYSFVEKSGSGKLGEKRNRLRGMPVLFSTQVKDDSNNSRYEEKNRRLIHVTPDTSKEKIMAAKRLIGLRYGCTNREYDILVVSKTEKEKAMDTIKIIIAKLKHHSTYFQPKQTGVKIPFQRTIVDSIPDDKVWEMTVAERTMKYLSIITKINMDLRPKIVNEKTGIFYPISTFEDLRETLQLMERGASGLRPYIEQWYNKVFLPTFRERDGKPNEDFDQESGQLLAKEKRPGLTSEQLSRKTKEVMGGPKLGSEELREKYLYPLINQGLIDKFRSQIDARENIYFPVEEQEQLAELSSSSPFVHDEKDLDKMKIVVKDSSIYPDKAFLEEQFRILSKYNAEDPASFEKNISYKIIDTDGTDMTLDQLIDRHFTNPQECFSKGYVESREENIPTTAITAAQASTISNIRYSQAILRKNIFSIPAQRSIFTMFHNNVLKETNEFSVSQETNNLLYSCRYCDNFETDIEEDYQRHVLLKHPGKLCYPSKADLTKFGLEPKGKEWEV
jgi:hypothetical protein